VNRVEFQQLAKRKLADAEALLTLSRWSAAYYHCGYVVECGMKACILARLEKDVGLFFEDKRLQEKSWKHVLVELLGAADLAKEFEAGCKANSNLEASWIIVKDWNESSRYQEWTEAEARRLFDAVNNVPDGVFAWIQLHW
jgi:HEPN domain-containing protein